MVLRNNEFFTAEQVAQHKWRLIAGIPKRMEAKAAAESLTKKRALKVRSLDNVRATVAWVGGWVPASCAGGGGGLAGMSRWCE
jgi:hypothetical protein